MGNRILSRRPFRDSTPEDGGPAHRVAARPRAPPPRRAILLGMRPLDAVYAAVVAAAVAVLLTPLAGALARRLGAEDRGLSRGLGKRGTPLLGGLAILAAVLFASLLWLPDRPEVRGILGGAVVITLVGAIDDVHPLRPAPKLLGQILATLIPVLAGVTVDSFTLPFLGHVDLGDAAGPATLIGLVAVTNVVNFSDGVDGLAAGVCAISGAAFAVIAFDLQRDAAATLAAITAGAALGFLPHNFHPARVYMGDCGALLLGYLLGCVAVYGTLKTNAVIALVAPLAILAVPFLDTSFVIAKRLKYSRAPWDADANHFHHRFARIGFSQRRTVLYLYAWTLCLAGLAVALRFVPYSDHHGHFDTTWSLVMGGLGLVALSASVYLVYVLEILKFRRLRERQLRQREPAAPEWEIERRVEEELGTGEWERVGR
jgi:UDP-GlcNAc:undecaprenyl-phosphate/decaprenyl-phosphate GlcNAc-1-phosphate transferase